MINKITVMITGFLFIATLATPLTAVAADIDGNICAGANLTFDKDKIKDKDKCDAEKLDSSKLDDLIGQIINILSVIVGVVAVIMIIVGGFKYITSGGDSNKIGSAKNTIVYAIVGLIIVALAQFIVRFVLTKVKQ